jgi:hypothetical protein
MRVPREIDEESPSARHGWELFRGRGDLFCLGACTVLGNDTVDEMKAANHAAQVVENFSRDEEDDNAPRPCGGNGFSHLRIHHLATGDGAVVIKRDDRQLHDTPARVNDQAASYDDAAGSDFVRDRKTAA